ncbi:hypothetical protein [Pacificimonas flava]|uniref:Uncharacterized protein n=1 Tax=Pacificimonas flava TaxID=1234595 RepID=M2T6J8_9SPHN|nr:hypothetical protein [Pacificimonas flava]EMD82144.1 hypothetical protein C725_2430 [Pacificimonas flava]MBB5280376.1 hypothetical protein [Pacificimonas flava]
MNRVRFGLTGLALVFLMVLTAAALFAPSPRVDTLGEDGKDRAEGADPLATLGVAPGSNEPERPPRAKADPPVVPAPQPIPVPMPDFQAEDPLDAIPVPPEQEKKPKGKLTEI